MSGRNWGIIVAAGLGVISFSAVGGFMLATQVNDQHEERIGRNSASTQHGHQPPQSAIDRAGLPSLVERAISNPQPQHGEDNEKRDLAAQEATATFTFWMVVLAAVQAIVAAIGIYYIRRTISQGQQGLGLARETKDETIRVGEAQTRAYLSVVRADFKINREPRSWKSQELCLHFHNSGETPAVNVSYFCTATVADAKDRNLLPDLGAIPFQDFLTNIPPGEAKKIDASCFAIIPRLDEFRKGWGEVNEDTPFGKMPILIIHGVAFYEDVFGHTFRSLFGFLIQSNLPEDKPWERDDLPALQGCIPTFERVRDRQDYMKQYPEG